MEQRAINFSQKQTSRRIKNNNIKSINKTRIIVMGKAYIINKNRLQTYKVIGDIVGVGLLVGMFYLMYCVMWILG